MAEPKPLEALIEEARLATLERYRALPAEHIEGLYRLSRETAESLNASHASVCFVDGTRVWFGGAFGFDRSDVARQGSFCDAVVRSGTPLLVPDGLDDPRFRQHELVCAQPGLRSYAGVPLIDAGGYTLGTVAVYSVRPGLFQSAIFVELGGLASLVRDFLSAPLHGPAALPPPARKVQAWLGVKATRPKLGRDERGEGLVVVSVARGSPAAEAGLRPADLLHAIDGQVLVSVDDIATAMMGRVVGTYARLSLRRGGQWMECAVEMKAQRRLMRVR